MYTVTFLCYPMCPRKAQQSRSGHWLAPEQPALSPAQAKPPAGVFGRNLGSELSEAR